MNISKRVPNAPHQVAETLIRAQDQQEYRKAEPLFRRALTIREKALGAKHPNVAKSLKNLAVACYRQKRYVEAESRYRRALVVLEKTQGPKHPEFAASLGKYAGTLRNLRRNDETTEVESQIKVLSAGSN